MNIVKCPVFILTLFFICSGCAQSHWRYPGSPGFDRGVRQKAEQKEEDYNIGVWVVSAFQKYISSVDSDRCPSLPSCSSYSISAFKEHGLLVGWLMTADRLIHEADEASVSPSVYYGGRFLVLDPVENNDFWWYDRGKAVDK